MAPGEQFSQRRIGLTGGIASGKSSVGRWLVEEGLPVLDADQYAREALAPGSQATNTVLQRYGPTVQADGGAAIDRAALGRIVFQDAAERQWLEQLIHPIVRERFDHALSLHAKTPAVVLMIPLLFEAGLESLCSEIWLVELRRNPSNSKRLDALGTGSSLEAALKPASPPNGH